MTPPSDFSPLPFVQLNRSGRLSQDPKDLSAHTDAELVEICRRELPYTLHAYQELLRRHETLVYSTCVNMLSNAQDAEEVTQDAFLQVYNKLHQFEGRSQFKTWLYRIVYNLCLNRRKSIAARRNRETQAGEEYAHKVETEQKAFFAAKPDDRVPAALKKLKDQEREIISLRFVSELSLAEIAEYLDLGLSATKMRLYRAMEEFKKIYNALPTEDDPAANQDEDHAHANEPRGLRSERERARSSV